MGAFRTIFLTWPFDGGVSGEGCQAGSTVVVPLYILLIWPEYSRHGERVSADAGPLSVVWFGFEFWSSLSLVQEPVSSYCGPASCGLPRISESHQETRY